MAYNPNRFSFSKIDVYNQCGMKYLWQYVYENWGPGSVATEVGSLIHKTEEEIAIAIKNHQPIDYVYFKNRLIKKMVEFEGEFADTWNEPDKLGRYYKEKFFEYLDSGIYYLEQYMHDHPTYEIVATEQGFNMKYGDYTFTGSIDRVIRDTATGAILVQDIKTYPEPKKEEELVTPLQFVVYVMAAAQLYQVPEESIRCQFYLPFVHGQYQDGGTRGYLDRGRKKIDKLLAGIKAEDWAPTPSALCHWCQFCPTNQNAKNERMKHLCPFFMHWTRENKTFQKENVYNKQDEAGMKALIEQYHAKYGVSPIKPADEK